MLNQPNRSAAGSVGRFVVFVYLPSNSKANGKEDCGSQRDESKQLSISYGDGVGLLGFNI